MQKDKKHSVDPQAGGIIVLDKPAGISSAGALNRVKRLLPPNIKIGHAGTLDPFATGILLLLVGPAVKSSQRFMDQPKTYEATVKFGAFTETDDPESPESAVEGAREPALEEIRRAIEPFIGTISQRPPCYSALKIRGRRACDRVRDGQTVVLAPRLVRIDAIEILKWEWPFLGLRIDCGRGTYIRSLARDIGEALKTGGYLSQLRRTRIGACTIEMAVTIEQLQESGVGEYLQAI